MKRTIALAAVLLCSLGFLAPAPVSAQYPVTDVLHIGVSVYNNLARYAQDAFAIYQRVQTIYNQYQQIDRQIQALKKLNYRSWRDIGPLYYNLNSLLGEAESLTYSLANLEEQFYATFPGSQAYGNFPSEIFLQTNRGLNTLRLNLLGLHRVNEEQQGSLQILGQIQNHADGAEGTEQILEAQAELESWQASQQATMGSSIQLLANTANIAASFYINQQAQIAQTQTDGITSTVNAAYRALGQGTTYQGLPPWAGN
jgi:P-type conjugative transfer protein TrbJ